MKLTKLKYRTSIVFYFFSLKRIVNLILNQTEFLLGGTTLLSFPRSVNLELYNYCNLRCPACPTNVHHSKRKKKWMSLEELREIVSQTHDFVFNFALGGNGEITLLDNLKDYLKIFKKNHLYVYADTNLNCSEERVHDLYKGVNLVNISLDGVTPETYRKYKIGGDFNKVLHNMILLLQWKEKNHSLFPFVQWQYIVNKFNEKEVAKAKKMAEEIGVDRLKMDPPFIPGGDSYFFEENPGVVKALSQKFVPRNEKYNIKDRVYLLACYQPFSELQILSNGDVIPCCRLREKNIVMGNIFKKTLKEIWNEKNFVNFRVQLRKQGRKPHCAVCLANMERFCAKDDNCNLLMTAKINGHENSFS